MSLNWNATKVEGWEAFDAEDRSLCGNFCWLLMAIGIGDVKADNIGEIAFRLRVIRGIHGTMLTGYEREDGTMRTADELADKYESPEFLVRLIGYHTNVTDESWSVWSKRVHNIHAGELQGKAKRLLEPVPA